MSAHGGLNRGGSSSGTTDDEPRYHASGLQPVERSNLEPFSGLAADLIIGAAAGCVGTWVTDQVQYQLWRAASPSAQRREPANEKSTARSLVRLLCHLLDLSPDQRRLETVSEIVHQGFGLGWGPLYGFLRRKLGLHPVSAGLCIGALLTVLVDEVAHPQLGVTPPNSAYPVAGHLRRLLGQLAYGASVAFVAEGLYEAMGSSESRKPSAGSA